MTTEQILKRAEIALSIGGVVFSHEEPELSDIRQHIDNLLCTKSFLGKNIRFIYKPPQEAPIFAVKESEPIIPKRRPTSLQYWTPKACEKEWNAFKERDQTKSQIMGEEEEEEQGEIPDYTISFSEAINALSRGTL